jgi:hypothetical protein
MKISDLRAHRQSRADYLARAEGIRARMYTWLLDQLDGEPAARDIQIFEEMSAQLKSLGDVLAEADQVLLAAFE